MLIEAQPLYTSFLSAALLSSDVVSLIVTVLAILTICILLYELLSDLITKRGKSPDGQ